MKNFIIHTITSFLFTGLLAGLPQHAMCEDISKTTPVLITADKLDYDGVADVYTAVGHVKIEHEGVRLEADKAVLNNKTGEASAEGSVVLQDKADMTRADKLQININTRSGVMYKGDLFKKKENLHVKGAVIERQSESVYHVEKGVITTCDEDEWYLKADELNVDMNRYATAKGVSFNLMGAPILYTPYFLFPVKRQTGFLMPITTFSSVDGLIIQNAFFWAISDYKDLTVNSDYRQKTGHGTGLEYRYMNSIESSGMVYTKFWDMFRTSALRESRFGHETSESRWEFRLQHREEFAEDLSGRIDINAVSDEHYYHDLDKLLEMKSKPYLDANAFFIERWNTAALYLLGQYSTDLTQSNRNTIQKLPEIRYMMFAEPLVGPVYLNFDGSAVNFSRQEGDGLRRLDFNPNIAAVFGSNGLSLVPRVGARATFYDRKDANASTNEPVNRTYVYAGLDMNARISRVYGADQVEGIGRVRHSIEPTVSYSYIPQFKRDTIPQFDSVDSVVSMNTVTVSLLNRISARYKESKDTPTFTNYDLMVFRISQGYNLSSLDTTSHASTVQADLYINAPRLFSITANGSYNPDTGHLSSRSAGAALTTDAVRVNVSYQWAREAAIPAEYLVAGGVLKLGKWSLSAQYSYDIANNVMTQQEYRARYGAQCWGLTIVFISIQGESRITAMVDLANLGGGGFVK